MSLFLSSLSLSLSLCLSVCLSFSLSLRRSFVFVATSAGKGGPTASASQSGRDFHNDVTMTSPPANHLRLLPGLGPERDHSFFIFIEFDRVSGRGRPPKIKKRKKKEKKKKKKKMMMKKKKGKKEKRQRKCDAMRCSVARRNPMKSSPNYRNGEQKK